MNGLMQCRIRCESRRSTGPWSSLNTKIGVRELDSDIVDSKHNGTKGEEDSYE